MSKEKILFIINPVSGTKNKQAMPALIRALLDKEKFEPEIVFTRHAGHARELTAEGAAKGFTTFAVIGGDGTMNEVARGIVHTPHRLALIPSGSGNGLSRHLQVPMDTRKAIAVINAGKTTSIDSGTVNGEPFFCTAGMGFDAHIGKLFAESATRGLSTYIKTTLSEFFNYQPREYTVTANGNTFTRQAFLLSFANAAQYGNNAYISPKADIADGLLDVCLLLPFPRYKVFSLGLDLFGKRLDRSEHLQILRTSNVTVTRQEAGPVHLDGEPCEMGERLDVALLPGSLKVLVP